MSLEDDVRERLHALEQTARRRRPLPITNRRGVTYDLFGRSVVGFCSNDYLGAHDLAVLDPNRALPTGTQTPPEGSTASRLICGDTTQHRELEHELADLLGTEEAIFFPSGYQANVSAIPALLAPHHHAYSDRLNHASIIDGLRLSSAPRTILDHRGPPPKPNGPSYAAWWLIESLYSMDGDEPDPEAMKRFQADGGYLYVDEAHAIGLHAGGTGFCDANAIAPEVRIATLGKAFGTAGAAVAASAAVCDLLRNTARGYVFTTGPSPSLCARITQRIRLLRGPEGDRRRAALRTNMQRLSAALDLPVTTPIVPLAVGDDATALDISARLLELGYHVQAIRPPTVPTNTARLRCTVTASHEPAQIEGLAQALRSVFEAVDLPLRRHQTETSTFSSSSMPPDLRQDVP